MRSFHKERAVVILTMRALRATTPMRAGALCTAIVLAMAGIVAAASRTTWDRVYTDDQALDGGAVYQERCSVCHGPNLEGGDDAPPLVGTQFSVVWDGRTLGDLVRRLQARMPQDAPGSLSRDAYTNIVAFLLRRNGFPAGSTTLSNDTAALNAIRYLAVAPPHPPGD